jgi:hypothetical protein
MLQKCSITNGGFLISGLVTKKLDFPTIHTICQKRKKKKPQGVQELVKKTKETSLKLVVMETNV